jgi:hypothetical protein
MVGLTVYSVLFRPEPKIDSRFVTVTESLLNLQNRVERIDQENQILFRMLRNENGLSETTSPLPVSVVPVLPPVKPLVKPLGDVINADTFGDKQE